MDDTIKNTIKNLNGNNIGGYFVRNKAELIELISKLIPPDAAVGCGDSVTLEQMGVFDWLRESPLRFYDKYTAGLTSKDKREIYLKNFSAHTFITGSNALTLDGKLFNIDGNGSRVAPMIYGPEQVIIVVGKNKIVENTAAAIERARQTAAPMDAKRLKKKTPCTLLNECVDCKHNERICNDFVLIAGQFIQNRIKVIIVDEILGY